MPRRYRIEFTRTAIKDLQKLSPKLKEKVKRLCYDVLLMEPYSGKRLVGELKGSYSLRLSYQDRLVYSVDEKKKIIYIERCRTHYGD